MAILILIVLKKFKVDGKYLVQPEPTPKQDAEVAPGSVPQKTNSRRKAPAVQAVIINDEPGVYYNYMFAKCYVYFFLSSFYH